jgi:hypothetical protein
MTNKWLDDYVNKHLEGNEIWEQKAMFDQKERAKMMIDALESEPGLNKEFFLELRRRKLNKIKK